MNNYVKSYSLPLDIKEVMDITEFFSLFLHNELEAWGVKLRPVGIAQITAALVGKAMSDAHKNSGVIDYRDTMMFASKHIEKAANS